MLLTLVTGASAPVAHKAENRPPRPCPQTSVRWTMKRKVAQRRTQCAYAHARSHSGSEQCYKVRRTGHTLYSVGVPRSTLPSSLQTSGHRKTCPKKQLNRFFLVQIDIAQVVHSSISVTSALTEWERRAGGHRRRHVRRKKVVPGSPVVHDLCAALRSKSGSHTSFFAAARPQLVRERCAQGGRVDELSDVLTLCSWARPLLTAVMYVQLGTSCPTSRTTHEWEQATK